MLNNSTLRALAGMILLALSFSTPSFAESGAEIYKQRCAPCHGSNGAGGTMLGKNLKLRPLTSPEVQNQSDQELEHIISHGRNKMPAYDRKLSRDQIAEVVGYIRALRK